jgi:hypothetical protein
LTSDQGQIEGGLFMNGPTYSLKFKTPGFSFILEKGKGEKRISQTPEVPKRQGDGEREDLFIYIFFLYL